MLPLQQLLFGLCLYFTDTIPPKIIDGDKVFDKVEIEARFPGGDANWRKYLINTLKAEVPTNNFAPPGAYTVVIQFLVDKEGNISEVKPMTNHGFGMEEEVIRVISKGPRWIPAVQDGRQVKAFRKQPITFQVTGEFELSTYTLEAGKENRVLIKDDEMNLGNYELVIKGGSLKMEAPGIYIIKVDKPGRVLLTAWYTRKKKKSELGTVTMTVK